MCVCWTVFITGRLWLSACALDTPLRAQRVKGELRQGLPSMQLSGVLTHAEVRMRLLCGCPHSCNSNKHPISDSLLLQARLTRIHLFGLQLSPYLR